MKILLDFLPILLFFAAFRYAESDRESAAAFATDHLGFAVSGGVVVVGERSWFVANDRLIAVDARNVVTRVIGLGDGVGADNAILAADSLWIPDEGNRQVVRIALTDLR